jgi:undecaprenyl-diphosphatase
LLLPAALFGWVDQGLTLDIAVHLGTLVAVIVYLRLELLSLIKGSFDWLLTRTANEDSRLAFKLAVATLPAGVAGFLFRSIIEANARSIGLVATTSIVFAVLLWLADRSGARRARTVAFSQLSVSGAFFIGAAQALALIPGTSRSGVTMTAARFLGISREDSARFSFLLSIPIILASGLALFFDARAVSSAVNYSTLAFAATVSALTAFLTIHYFMRLLPKIGVLPFVIYRILFGVLLIVWLV